MFDRSTEGRFPEVKEIKQMIRDQLVPYRDLGHSDVQELNQTIQNELTKDSTSDDAADELSDEEAEEQRKFFGVN